MDRKTVRKLYCGFFGKPPASSCVQQATSRETVWERPLADRRRIDPKCTPGERAASQNVHLWDNGTGPE
jgi:hypothetical protein